ncbi:HIT family protein [Sphingomonas sp.]|uniref:HIT family protein n=1 Tax=Sphingomonas sp. TaxID=28214 RepID=UPI003B3BA14D
MIAIVAPLLAACAPVPQPALQAPPQVAFSAPYNSNNPFALIVRGTLPAAKVYEDRDVLAFMDNAPASPGHVLVILKRSQARNLLEIRNSELKRLFRVARRIGAAELAGLGADGFTIEQNNGYGQSVPHFHIHVIPRYAGYSRCPASGIRQPLNVLEPFAVALRAALADRARR